MRVRVVLRQFIVTALFLAVVSAVSGQSTNGATEPNQGAEATYRGGLVSPPLPKPKFTLTDTSGARYDLRTQTQGYVTLLFFGYTHCPDMCPLEMSTIAQAMEKMTPAVAKQFKVIFVTTDPARDSGVVLRSWLNHFNGRFIGLTGSEESIVAAQIAANLPPAKKSSVRPDGTYEVGHAAFVLAYTKDNLAHVIYPVGVSLQDWVHDLPSLAKETWTNH